MKTKFSFSHFFCRAELNSNAIAIYKNGTDVKLVHEYRSNRTKQKAVFFTEEKWAKEVAKTEHLNELSSLAFMLDKYFNTEFFKN